MELPASMTYRQALLHASDWELRTKPYVRPYRGVVRLDADPLDPSVRIADVLPLLTPGDVLTGWAALHLHGVGMVDGLDAARRPMPVVVASGSRGQHRPQPGLVPTRRGLLPGEVEDVASVPVATMARAAYDMALDARGLDDAVVAIDMCTTTTVRQSRTTLAAVESTIGRHRKTRGIVRARRAVELASDRSASPWETRTRLAARRAGVTDVLVNAPLFDLHGRLLGVADLLEPDLGLVLESDGDQHLDRQARTKDHHRQDGMELAGLVVRRVTALDHRDRIGLEARIARRPRTRRWTVDPPDWWWTWPAARRWDGLKLP